MSSGSPAGARSRLARTAWISAAVARNLAHPRLGFSAPVSSPSRLGRSGSSHGSRRTAGTKSRPRSNAASRSYSRCSASNSRRSPGSSRRITASPEGAALTIAMSRSGRISASRQSTRQQSPTQKFSRRSGSAETRCSGRTSCRTMVASRRHRRSVSRKSRSSCRASCSPSMNARSTRRPGSRCSIPRKNASLVVSNNSRPRRSAGSSLGNGSTAIRRAPGCATASDPPSSTPISRYTRGRSARPMVRSAS